MYLASFDLTENKYDCNFKTTSRERLSLVTRCYKNENKSLGNSFKYSSVSLIVHSPITSCYACQWIRLFSLQTPPRNGGQEGRRYELFCAVLCMVYHTVIVSSHSYEQYYKWTMGCWFESKRRFLFFLKQGQFLFKVSFCAFSFGYCKFRCQYQCNRLLRETHLPFPDLACTSCVSYALYDDLCQRMFWDCWYKHLYIAGWTTATLCWQE